MMETRVASVIEREEMKVARRLAVLLQPSH
jgi:hypothetical protein